ncbi:unnamed protein product [Rhizoctonia solani]|uniref:Uncharacterized protein n=1 Tax=Rhizoctonia solani TaxID=456999 RepID=A0A8H2WQA2_9AGAM|nr:unnamed protein product [Rhizoctonia solani]
MLRCLRFYLTRFLRDTWLGHTELTDAKDSKALMHGYVHRISTSDTWHYKPHITSILPILEFVVRFAQPGAENVFLLLFSATTRFLWGEIEGKKQITENDITGMISIFHCFLKLLQILPDAAHCAMQNLMQDIVNSDLVGLIARLIVLRRPTMEKTDNERVRNHQFLAKARTFFERIKSKIPPEILSAKPRPLYEIPRLPNLVL